MPVVSPSAVSRFLTRSISSNGRRTIELNVSYGSYSAPIEFDQVVRFSRRASKNLPLPSFVRFNRKLPRGVGQPLKRDHQNENRIHSLTEKRVFEVHSLHASIGNGDFDARRRPG